jgi:hypothetical protein
MRWDEMPEIPFSDFGVKWFEDIIGKITGWFADELASGYEAIRDGIFGTPLPDGSGTSLVFGAPSQSDEPWHSIYEAVVAGEVMVFALLIAVLTTSAGRDAPRGPGRSSLSAGTGWPSCFSTSLTD